MRKVLSFIFIFLFVSSFLVACGGTFNEDFAVVPENSVASSGYENDLSFDDSVNAPSIINKETPSNLDSTIDELPSDSFFEIHFIDVGQADAALVLCDGRAMLIDGGNADDSSLIYSYLQVNNVNYLDYIVCTHGHEDHVGGLAGALNFAKVGIAYSPVKDYSSKAFGNFVKYLGEQGVDITVPNAGDSFSLGSADVEVLGPISDSDEPNNTSIVLRITYGNTSFLFTGDAELEEETEILDAGFDVSCDVLKTGHHGSDTSTGYRWLREAAPEYAVISVGEGNSYGHPTEAVLSRFRDAEVSVYRTDIQGHIICRSDGSDVSFEVQRNKEADTLTGVGMGGDHFDNGGNGSDVGTTQGTDEFENKPFYVCNTNTKKFHFPDCSSVGKMAEKNRLEVSCSREELISQGYEACKNCQP